MPTTEAVGTAKNGNGKAHGSAEGLAEGLAESFEGLATIARTQTEESIRQGEMVGLVLKDQAIVSIKSAESMSLSMLSALGEVTVALMPKLPRVVPLASLDTLVKAGFDITQQLLDTVRKLSETAVGMETRLVA